MESENVTFCEALLKINEAQFDCSDELQLTITNQFASRVKPLLPSFDYISREPKALIHRMSSLGLEPDSSDTLETLIPSPLTIAEEDFKHSYNRLIALPTVYELKDKVCKFNRFLGMNNFSVIEVGAEVHIGNLKEAIKDWISTGSGELVFAIHSYIFQKFTRLTMKYFSLNRIHQIFDRRNPSHKPSCSLSIGGGIRQRRNKIS